MSKAFLIIASCLFIAGGCARTTHVPSHNLTAEEYPARTLMLTQIPAGERTAAVDRFVNAWPQSGFEVIIAYGDNVDKMEIEQLEAVLTVRGVDSKDISQRRTGAGNTLGLVFAGREKSGQPFDNYWFSDSAVSKNFAKSTNANMASQAANPNDLVKPEELGAPNPMAASGAVERYQKGEVRKLGKNSAQAGGSSSSSSN